jgi:hypothetical protein
VDGLVSSRTYRNGTVDVLGQTITELLYRERRALLDGLCLGGAAIVSASTPSDGKATRTAIPRTARRTQRRGGAVTGRAARSSPR